MQSPILESWFNDLISKTSGTWRQTIRTAGICRTASSSLILYAAVEIAFSPSEQFEAIESLPPGVGKLVRERGWYDHVIFGVLDILMTVPEYPFRNIRIDLQQVDYNEIESKQIAFRWAARDAAVKALNVHFPNIRLLS